MEKSGIIIEQHYLPNIAYFCYLSTFERVYIDPEDRYIKQTYRNRCIIKGANKTENLIIPIKKISGTAMKTADCEIDYQQKWLNKHLRAIQSAYGKAPFYEYYIDEMLGIFSKKPKRLFDLNRQLLTKCLDFLEIKIDIHFEGKIENTTKKQLFDAKNLINPKNAMIDHKLYRPKKYFQVFGNNFVENLSIIDLIFCEGPGAKQILRNCCAATDNFDK